jgi:TRAP-type C4-dicarboxylate transport system permease small subunit
MSDSTSVRAHATPGQRLERLASLFAVGGGLVLVFLTLLVVVSVLGRALFALPVPGDFEIVGFGTAISVFLFLPYCYVRRGNVAIDIFVRHMPLRVQQAMDAFAAVVFAVIAGTFAWRMLFGLADTFHYGDISMIVGVPLWWAYPFGLASFALLAAAAVFTAVHGWEAFDVE